MTQLALDPCRCPLCGQLNACAMALAAPNVVPNAAPSVVTSAAAAAPRPCWCTRVHFSADLLKQVPAAARNQACICAACVAASEDDKTQNPTRGEGA